MKSETFVTFEQAVALKECGFDWECNRYYSKEDAAEGTVWEYPNPTYENFNDGSFGSKSVSAPTLAFAQKWLREVKKIDIEVMVIIYADRRRYSSNICYVGEAIIYKGVCTNAQTYEIALSAGLDAALGLIKQK